MPSEGPGDEGATPLPPPPRGGPDGPGGIPPPPTGSGPGGLPQWGSDDWPRPGGWQTPGGPLRGPGRGPGYFRRDPSGHFRAMTVADVLDGTFRLLKDHWRTFFLAVGGVLVPLSLLSNVVLAAIAPEFIVPDLEALLDPEQIQATGPLFGAEFFIASLALAAVGLLFTTPITWAVSTVVAGAAIEGQSVNPGEAVRRGLRRWPALLAAFLLQGLVYVLLAVLVGLLTFAAVQLVGDIGALIVLPLLLLWGVVALWLYVRWSLSTPVVVLEGLGPIAAMRRAWRLSGTRFWWLLGTLILVQIIATVVGGIAGTPFQLVSLTPGLSTFVAALIVSLGSVVSGLITTPVTVNALSLLYTDRRVRAEGADLLPGQAGPGSPWRAGEQTRRW